MPPSPTGRYGRPSASTRDGLSPSSGCSTTPSRLTETGRAEKGLAETGPAWPAVTAAGLPGAAGAGAGDGMLTARPPAPGDTSATSWQPGHRPGRTPQRGR